MDDRANQVSGATHDLRNPTPAVVVGLCTHGLAIVRSLGRRGVPVWALESNPRRPGWRTRYADSIWVHDINGPSLIEDLVTLSKKLPTKPVLFLTNDNMVRNVCSALPIIDEHYHFNFPSPEIVRRLLDKRCLADWSIERGFRYPRTFYVSNRKELEQTGGLLNYPAALKPSQPLSNFKARRIEDEKQLEACFDRYFDGTTLLIQEWVDGTERSIYFCNYYFDHDARPVAQFVGRKIRSFPRLTGGASSAEPSDRTDLLELGLRFFEGSSMRGPAAIEFKEGPDRRLYVIEPTLGRFDFYIHCCTLNGVDMPYLSYCSMASDLLPARQQQSTKRSNTAWVDVELDFPVLVDSFFRADEFLSALSFVFRKKGFALWARDDYRPSFYAWPRGALRYSRKLFRRMRELPSHTESVWQRAEASNTDYCVEVASTYRRFIHLKSDWDECCDRGGSSSVFLTHEWFENFIHEVVDKDARLAIYVIRDKEGTVAAIFPLMLDRTKVDGIPVHRLKFLANFYSPVARPIWGTTSPDEREILARRFVQEVKAHSHTWGLLEFSPLPDESGDLELLVKALHHEGIICTTYFASANWYLPTAGMTEEQYTAMLPSRVRNTMRRRRRRAEKRGDVDLRVYTEPADVEAHIGEYYAIYDRSWKRPEPYSQFHARLASKLARSGCTLLGVLYYDGEPVAAQLWLIYRSEASILKLCHDEAFKEYSFGTILTHELITFAIGQRKVEQIDYLTGDEDYKRDWMSSRRRRRGIRAYGKGLGRLVAAMDLYVRPVAKRLLKSKRGEHESDQRSPRK